MDMDMYIYQLLIGKDTTDILLSLSMLLAYLLAWLFCVLLPTYAHDTPLLAVERAFKEANV